MKYVQVLNGSEPGSRVKFLPQRNQAQWSSWRPAQELSMAFGLVWALAPISPVISGRLVELAGPNHLTSRRGAKGTLFAAVLVAGSMETRHEGARQRCRTWLLPTDGSDAVRLSREAMVADFPADFDPSPDARIHYLLDTAPALFG